MEVETGMIQAAQKESSTQIESAKKNGVKKRKTSAKKNKKSQLGSVRGIESLFRNSYRAQLDMITLAATKANIMISLNGLMVSFLLIASSHFLVIMPMLIIPFAVFLLTCTVSVIFAVLAARPLVDKTEHTLDDFRFDRSGLLVFEQYSKLQKKDYIDLMEEMVSDKNRIYRNMIGHLHHFGRSADFAYARLYISYNVFMVGLVLSVILLGAVLVENSTMPWESNQS